MVLKEIFKVLKFPENFSLGHWLLDLGLCNSNPGDVTADCPARTNTAEVYYSYQDTPFSSHSIEILSQTDKSVHGLHECSTYLEFFAVSRIRQNV